MSMKDCAGKRLFFGSLIVIAIAALVIVTIPIWYWKSITCDAPGSQGLVILHLRVPITWRTTEAPGHLPSLEAEDRAYPWAAGTRRWVYVVSGRDLAHEGSPPWLMEPGAKKEQLSMVHGFRRVRHIGPDYGRCAVVLAVPGDRYLYVVASEGDADDPTVRRIMESFWVEPAR